jgi:proteasome lid subunit RPN8/RPN11
MGHTLPTKILYSQALKEAIAHAQSSPLAEVCGLITWDESKIEYSPCLNESPDPANTFRLGIDSLQKVLAHNQRCIVVHSHLEGHIGTLSADDVYDADRAQLPYLLLHGENHEQLEYYDPIEAKALPYEGRPWRRYSSNCFTLVRDWLRAEKNFDLEEAIVQQLNHRGFNVNTVSQAIDGLDLQTVISMAYGALEPVGGWESSLSGGFGQTIEAGDILIMRSDMDLPAHIGVMLSPESNEFVHQTFDRPSRKDSFNRLWRKAITEVVRPVTGTFPYKVALSTKKAEALYPH